MSFFRTVATTDRRLVSCDVKMWTNALSTMEAATQTRCVRMNLATSRVHATTVMLATDLPATVSG